MNIVNWLLIGVLVVLNVVIGVASYSDLREAKRIRAQGVQLYGKANELLAQSRKIDEKVTLYIDKNKKRLDDIQIKAACNNIAIMYWSGKLEKLMNPPQPAVVGPAPEHMGGGRGVWEMSDGTFMYGAKLQPLPNDGLMLERGTDDVILPEAEPGDSVRIANEEESSIIFENNVLITIPEGASPDDIPKWNYESKQWEYPPTEASPLFNDVGLIPWPFKEKAR